jgi:two-component system chemotaxis sensor kinase CheA
LVADDSDFFRGQIQRLVEAVGCRVLAAEDGQAAWELLDLHADEVDMLATDVEMPRMDGLALTRRIRADGRFAQLPIIALSSLAGEEEIASGLAAGVNEYQVKLNKDELIESIRKAVSQRANGPVA